MRGRTFWLAGVAVLSIIALAWWQFTPRATVDGVALLRKAVAAINRDQRDQAQILLDQLLHAEPRNGMALLYRGQIARDGGDADAAVADWKLVEDGDVKAGATARYLEGTVALERGEAERSEQLFKRAIELRPDYLKPRERLLEMYVVQIRRADARKILTGIGGLRLWTVNELVFQIVPLERATHSESGASMMRSALKASPGDESCTIALARYLMEGEHDAEAVGQLRPLHTSDPQNEVIGALLGEALLRSGNRPAAREMLDRYALTQSSSPLLWEAKGRLAVEDEDWPVAMACLARAVENDAENLAAWHQLGDACRRAGKTDDAKLILNRALEIDSLQKQALRLVWGNQQDISLVAPILNEVAEMLLLVERPDDAVRWFEKSNALIPSAVAAEGIERAREAAQNAARSSNVPALLARLSQSEPASSPGLETETPPHAATSSDDGIPKFQLTDVHESAGIDFQYFGGNSEFKYLLESTGGAVGVIDYDRDGWSDLYLPQGCKIPVNLNDHTYSDQLYRNHGDQTFRNVTTPAGVREYGYGQGVAVGDLNADGFSDLAVGNYGRSSIFLNEGDGTLTDATSALGISAEEMTSSLAFADFDNDGLLDLYVVNYLDSLKVCRNSKGTYNACSPTNFEGAPDRLYWNSGDGRLIDVTEGSGILAPGGKGLGIVAADFDDDGKIDVFISNDTTPNYLFHNESERGRLKFDEQGLLAGVAVSEQGRAQAGMGIAAGDFDANGRQDLFVTNFYLESNSLFLNEDGTSFIDASRTSGMAEASMPWLGFGTQGIDLALRGHPDLFVANGHIDDFSEEGEPWKMPPQVFAWQGPGRYVEVSTESGEFFQGRYLGRGVARLDFDGDTRPDLAVAHQDRPLALLRNETQNPGHSLVLNLIGVESNREAIGARVDVLAGGRQQTLWINGGDGYFASNERCVVIGIGDADRIGKLIVKWPSGQIDTRSDVPPGNVICIEGRESLPDLP